MRRVNLSVPVYLPDRLHRALRTLRASLSSPAPDLSGDRDIEWSWVAAHIPQGPGEALDFGCGTSPLGLLAAERGFRVTAVDREDVAWPYRHERLRFVRGDLLSLDLGPARFDLVLNCSTVEHVGLPGRYGLSEAIPDGDLAAMARLRALMKPGGRMLLTVPVGRDAVFPPWHRVYGRERLPRLVEGFSVERRAFWVKEEGNRWVPADEPAALAVTPGARLYGLGCFVLVAGRARP